MSDKRIMKPLKDLDLMDRFLFAEAMEDPVICKHVLEIILGTDIRVLGAPQAEKEIRTSPMLRSIRMDVYAVDEESNVYSVEAQKANTGNIPKRSRYYQALLDSSLLEPGVLDFNLLHDSYMIMVSPFDLFGRGLYRYTFTEQCEEVAGLKLGDGATRIFLNTRGTCEDGVSAELVELLHYIERSDGAASKSSRIREIHEHVLKIKSSEEIGVKYMQAWEEKAMMKAEAMAEGKAEGKAEGIAEGKAEGEARYSRLILELVKAGKPELIVEAASNPELLQQLYVEYEV